MRKQFLKIALFLILTVSGAVGSAQQIALLKYRGGGDWYANPTSLPNLIAFCNQNLSMSLDPKPATVEVGSTDLFQYPFVHMTGHGNVVFSQEEAQNLRMYLLSGGFLHIDDNYGLNNFIRTQMKLVFPELDFVELPYSHPIFHQKYPFPNGTSMTASLRRLSGWYGKDGWCACSPTSATLATAGRTQAYTTTRRPPTRRR